MKLYLVTLVLLFGCVLGEEIYDLDDSRVLQDLESDGLYFKGEGIIESLRISTSSGSTGFSWLIDRGSCRGIIDVTNGFVFSQPDGIDENTGLLISSGSLEEIFTITALDKGQCTFRIAYANPGTGAFSFDDYSKNGGLVIQIPI